MTVATLTPFEYFPTVVYRDEHPEWVQYSLANMNKHFDNSCSNNNYIEQSKSFADDKDFNFLIDYFIKISDTVLRDQGYDMDLYNLYVSGLWGQLISKDGSTNIHVHGNSQLSGWFFLEAPEGGSYPIYYDTRNNKEMIELASVQNNSNIMNSLSAIHFNNIIPGTILFSNSWVKNQLTPNYSSKQTKVIHFIISHKDKLCSTC